MADLVELKPCPFCGQPAALEHLENGQWSIGCGDDQECVGWMIGSTYARQSEAIAAWNTRHPDPKALAVIAEARGVLHDALMPDGIYPSDAEPVIARLTAFLNEMGGGE